MKKIISALLIIMMLFATVVLTSCDAVEVISGIGKILGFVKPLIEEHVHVTGPIPDIESTCMEHGRTSGVMCLTCGEILIEPTEAPLAPHRYDGDNDPTCNICNYERFCLHRNTEKIAGKAATCKEPGYTESEVCLGCNKTLILKQEIPLAAHTEGSLKAVESTCYSNGLTEGKYCTVCDTVLVPQMEAPLKPHNEAILQAKESTCTEAGLTQGKYCTECNKVLVPQEKAPLTNHTYSSDSDMSCNVCPYTRGCTHSQIVILGAKESTCTQTGLTEGKKCGVCNEIIIAQAIIPVKPHTETTISAVAASCTQTGLTEGKRCSTCNAILAAQTVIALKDHTETAISAVAASCTKTGLTEGKKCAICDKITLAQNVTDILPHTESDWIIDTAATETTEGTKHVECTVCKTVLKQESITENVVYSITTKTGWVSKSSSNNPGLKYSAEIQYRNRTNTSVEVRMIWTASITAGSYDRYGQYFKFSVGSVSSGNVKVVSFDAWKNTSSSERSKTASSSWVTVPLSSADDTSIDLSVYYWQTNSKGTDMYKYDGTPCVKTTWTVAIPAVK